MDCYLNVEYIVICWHFWICNRKPEMGVKEIILANVSRLCQLSSHSRGLLSKLLIFKCTGPSLWISWAHKTPSYNTKCFWRSFVKFMIINNFKQNIDETYSKQPKIHRNIHTSLWILKISRKKSANQKSRDFWQMFVIPKRKPYPSV